MPLQHCIVNIKESFTNKNYINDIVIDKSSSYKETFEEFHVLL